MGTARIRRRESQLMQQLWSDLARIPNLEILAGEHRDRIGIVSFNIRGLHHNLAVKMLNDHFGIQVRGGCSCAGTYGHYLLSIDKEASNRTLRAIDERRDFVRPGWVRLSIHPTMTSGEINYLTRAIAAVARNHRTWIADYDCCPHTARVRCRRPEADASVLAEVAGIYE